MPIHFGTDGWRAVIGEDFTFENVRLVAQAISDYLKENAQSPDAPIVIGFDTRFLSDRFAIAVSEVLAANDLRVILSRADCATPVVAYAVRALRAQAGIMITASHNPPRYSGIKLKNANGASASPSETARVEEKLRAVSAPKIRAYADALKAGMITRTNFFPIYFQHIQQVVNLQTIGQGQWRVVADPMYGAGRGYLRSILTAAGCEVLEIRGEMNPGFGGIHPEPIEKYLFALMAAVRDHHSDIGLATDGDADRIGAVDDAGNFIDPHFIFALTLRYLVDVRKMRGAVVKTISTTQMINLLAEKYALPLHETPVGFNHIADLMQEHDVLMGGEESGGITIRGHVPMGDGILMGLLLMEMMSHYGKGLRELCDELRAELGAFYYARRDLRTKPFSKKDLVTRLKNDAPATMAGLQVVSVNDRDGVKYLFEDSSWLLIRPSGTEPVLRVYSEARSPELVEELLTQGVALSDAMRNGS
ncbi:MAG: phosphoglucomutase/phosphomannomutase family protein [Chloroflexota bacterium]|nr:MAG: phosphoglucomutase/phosphomannomutase family protein [Chloroflexota bacterium]